jgi:hypothetical protein
MRSVENTPNMCLSPECVFLPSISHQRSDTLLFGSIVFELVLANDDAVIRFNATTQRPAVLSPDKWLLKTF